MQASIVESSALVNAVNAAKTIAVERDLVADEAIVLRNSNTVALRLLPCDVFAGVSPAGTGRAAFEIRLAQRLVAADSPVAVPEPRVEARAYEHAGFEVALWTYYETVSPPASAAECATALVRLHAGMRATDFPVPHFTSRVADTDGNIARTPLLDDTDRGFLSATLRDLERAVLARDEPEQRLHGEPHAGNLLSTKYGPLFIDLETCCLGPVEFDLAHMPAAVGDHYPDADRALLEDCRGLVLAVVAKHRCNPFDEFPNRQQALADLISALRSGPPWPTLDQLSPQHD
jgi:aminoglycoside phosphotransferase (APT) family kinase protein